VARTRFETIGLDGVGREVLLAFRLHALIRFREQCAFPDCFCHETCFRLQGEKAVAIILNPSGELQSVAINGRAFNGHSMVGRLQRVLVCSPRASGWNQPAVAERWQELGFFHTPDFATSQAQHDELCRQLESAGAEVFQLPPASDLSLDAVYTHDPSLACDHGLIGLHPGKPNRIPEAQRHLEFCRSLGIPALGQIQPPGKAEAGDMVWLDSTTLLVGQGYRTNRAGIAQMRALLQPHGVEVISAPLPYGPGPSACLHLMSLMSQLDERTALVDLPWLAVETVDLLQSRSYRLVEIEYAERETLACNVLSLGDKHLIALEENQRTNQKLRQAGFDVRTFPGSELCINGGGGPTCLTRPLLRT
jgi:N-dimethylarginine dimethylaminohydrolase